jgi:anaerobic magnesium-protoporphyrin IX monomethyl ester cyclase
MLKRAGHEVTFIDFPITGRSRKQFDAFSASHDFDVIVFYTVFLSKRTDILARDLLQKNRPTTSYVFMATEPSACPDDFINEKSVILRGEPEAAILPLIDSLAVGGDLESIPGVSYLADGERIHNPTTAVIENLDELPFPDRSLLPRGNYNNPKLSAQPFTTMLASRGCSFGCYYCVPNSLSFAREIEHKRTREGKPPVRFRSPENVIAEFAELARAGYRAVSFVDDEFVWGADRTVEICRGIGEFGLDWSCLARADMLLDSRVTTAMGQAGCKYVDIGVESFNQEILDYIGKRCKVESVYTAVENLKAAGIEPELNILIGSSPLETEETIERTFQETLRLDVDYALFSVCTPFPYTEFNRIAREQGWMIKPEYEAIDPIKESFISYPHLTKEQLDRSIRQLYRRFYFRPSYLLKRLRKVRSAGDLANKVRAALTILR